MKNFMVTPFRPIEVEAENEKEAIKKAKLIAKDMIDAGDFNYGWEEDTEIKQIPMRSEIAVTIFWSDANNGYQFDIYENSAAIEENDDPLDGGLCTGSFQDAMEMAFEQTKEYVHNEEEKKNKEELTK